MSTSVNGYAKSAKTLGREPDKTLIDPIRKALSDLSQEHEGEKSPE